MTELKIFLMILLALVAGKSFSQNIYISTEQELNFGDFYISGTGDATIMLSDTGQRSSSGNVNFLNNKHHPVTYILTTDNPTPLQVQVDTPTSVLTNAEGKKMSVRLNPTDNLIHTLQKDIPKRISLGGILTLDLETGTSPGNYSGNILITVMILNE
ncbi:MAG TPA: DUF4402 domain-containing protein [Gillisia sp.]|nr:DUF4402 domain-containing protein [Gillisia sp.]